MYILNILNRFIIASFLVLFLSMWYVPAVQAQGFSKWSGLNETAGENAAGFNTGGTTSIPVFIGRIIQFGLALIGSIFMVLVIIAYLKISGAGGNEEEVVKGKKWIKNGAIGVLAVLAAYTLTVLFLWLLQGKVYLFTTPAAAQAANLQESFGTTLDEVALEESTGYRPLAGTSSTVLAIYIGNAVAWTGLLGLSMLAHIVMAGYEYMTAQDNAERVVAAKKRIKNIVIAGVILVGGYLITTVIIYTFVNITGYQG